MSKHDKHKMESKKAHEVGLRAETILQASLDGFCVVDTEGVILEVNSAYCAISGYSKEELVGKHLDDIEANETSEQVSEHIREVMEKGYCCFETKHYHKDGTILDIEVSSQLFDYGKNKYFFSFFRNITNRKQIEEDLSLKNKAINSSINAIAIVDLDGKLSYVNSAFLAMWGYSDEAEVLGRFAVQFWADVDRAEEIKKTVEDKGGWLGELVARRKDGSTLAVELSASLVRDEGNNPVCLMASFVDITEKKKVVEELKKTKGRLEHILSTNPATTYTCKVGDDWAATFISENVRNQFGHEPRQFLEDPNFWLAHIHPGDSQHILAELSRLLENDYHIHEYRFLHKDGSYRWVHDEVRLIRDEEGKPLECIGYWMDITDLKKTEEALRESEDRYKTLFQDAAEGILVADIETKKLKYANPAICRILGYTEKEIKGMHVHDIHPKEDLEYVLSEFEAQARGEKTLALSIPCLQKDGTIVYANINAAEIMIDGRVCNVGFFTNITEYKRIKDELENHKDKVLNAQKHAYIASMGAIVAHQLNQPLTAINMRLGKALEMVEESNCSPKCLDNVKKSLAEAKRAASIIRKFRQYSRDPDLEITGKVKISDTANRIIPLLSEKAVHTKMAITAKGLSKLPDVEINETALEQILYIIIQNAIEASDGKRQHKLNILGKFVDGFIELQFSDDCCGIAPENLEKIFEPFFSTKSDGKGIGLGLDIVRQILISCGGEIWVESKLGKGATFYVTLPISNNSNS